MSQTIAAEFETRREAEMSVEHLVQEYGLDRGLISILPVDEENSAGSQVAGSDLDERRPRQDETQPVLSGRIKVSVQADESQKQNVLKTFRTYGGK